MRSSLPPSELRQLQSMVKADAAASQVLHDETGKFSRGNTGEVVKAVNSLIQAFVWSTSPATPCWTKVYTFGSSGLGAAIAGSDIDLIALCSSSIDVTRFYTQLPHFINGRLADLVVVTSTRVPLLKFTHSGVHVDLLFASVDGAQPPTTDEVLSDEFLFRVSEPSRATVNGIRTILEITRRLSVPHEAYACVLRAVKYWATRRQVYGNLYTFPNGVCLAILVARASQLCTVTDSSALLRFFFLLLVRCCSVGGAIAPISIVPQDADVPVAVVPGMPRAWDATRDVSDLFPVLNPARPCVNAAYTVGRCGMQLFYRELRRAEQLLGGGASYAELWEPYSILHDYHYFVSVHISAVHAVAATCESVLNAWKGYMESKLRMLVYALECVVEVRPFPRAVVDAAAATVVEDGVTLHQSSRVFFFGVRRGDARLRRSDVAEALREFEYAVVEGTTMRHGFERDECSMRGPWFSFFSQDPVDGLPCPALAVLRTACAEAASGASLGSDG